jgi:acetolactate synthase-1/2/3 large subunit
MLKTAVDCGVEVCFSNPGTTEMGIVAALDKVDGMRSVLGLFEGVCTGAADGYGRMTGRPALTLVHLGPGFANGIANLHNARKASTPIVNMIGDHPQRHLAFDAPLTADLDGLAGAASDWHRFALSAEQIGTDMAEAIAVSKSPAGQVASLVVPCDVANASVNTQGAALSPIAPERVSDAAMSEAIAALTSGEPAAILLGDRALHERSLRSAGRIAKATGCRLVCETIPARWERGAGLPVVQRVPYFPEDVLKFLEGLKHLIVIGSKIPVSFFYYEGYPSQLLPEGCEAQVLARREDDVVAVLDGLADEIGVADADVDVAPFEEGEAPVGDVNLANIGQSVGCLLPEGAVVVEEGNTSGHPSFLATRFAQRHTMLFICGGSIGYGLPAATGAAVACPDQQVISLQADGSGMYTLQALWTQARESLDVTTVIFANRRYNILQIEMHRAGIASPGPKATDLTDLSKPDINWCDLARGLGVPATRPESAEAFHKDLARALAEPGPHLIEALI